MLLVAEQVSFLPEAEVDRFEAVVTPHVQLFFVGFFTMAVLSLTFIKHQQR